jgi:hypothetical protein
MGIREFRINLMVGHRMVAYELFFLADVAVQQ